jgi:transposase
MTVERRVGLDLGLRTKHRAVVYDGAARRGKPFAVEVSREGFDELVRRATEGTDGPVTFVMEPTGLAWVPVASYVIAAGHRVNLANPQQASDLRKVLRKHAKSDVIDAGACARLPEIHPDGMHELRLPSAEQMSLRRLVKRRDRLVSDNTRTKLRIEALMVMANPALMDAFGEHKFGAAANAFYRQYADPEMVLRRGRTAIQRLWDRHGQGKADPDRVAKMLAACRRTVEMYRDARAKGLLPFDYAQVQDEICSELDAMERTQLEIDRLEKQIGALYVRLDPDRTLEQLRGVSLVIASALEALVGDVRRFANARRFVSYTGLAPRLKKSGLSDPSMPITKAGQRLLKKYLYLAADVARQWDPDFAAYYARRYARGDHHNRILIALARKMALRVYSLLKRREAARRGAEQGREATPPVYELRDSDGCPLDKKQARNVVLERYARSVIDPKRDARDRTRRGNVGERRCRMGVAVSVTPQAESGVSDASTCTTAALLVKR